MVASQSLTAGQTSTAFANVRNVPSVSSTKQNHFYLTINTLMAAALLFSKLHLPISATHIASGEIASNS